MWGYFGHRPVILLKPLRDDMSAEARPRGGDQSPSFDRVRVRRNRWRLRRRADGGSAAPYRPATPCSCPAGNRCPGGAPVAGRFEIGRASGGDREFPYWVIPVDDYT